jgi:predicted nucleic acid-binding protein
MRIFVDSDVVISSLLSSSGASYFLLNQSQITPIISTVSLSELRIVVQRLGIPLEKLETFIKEHFEVFKLTSKIEDIKIKYEKCVTDINDAHIVAGARESGAKYLISYNLKHFKTDTIKDKYDVLLLTPALFLQYMRSQ